jgi:hypothetical protein
MTMKVLGTILICAGLLALVYGGFSYTKQKKVLDIGALEAHVDQKKTVPVSPVAGGVAILAGIAMVIADRRRIA